MEELSELNRLKENLDVEESVVYKRENIESKDSRNFLAENNGKLLGFISGTLKESNPMFERGEKMKINELFVKEKFRREGVASKLMDKIVDVAESQNCDTIELGVNVDNESARKLYSEKGFDGERIRMIKRI